MNQSIQKEITSRAERTKPSRLMVSAFSPASSKDTAGCHELLQNFLPPADPVLLLSEKARKERGGAFRGHSVCRVRTNRSVSQVRSAPAGAYVPYRTKLERPVPSSTGTAEIAGTRQTMKCLLSSFQTYHYLFSCF